MTLFKLFFVFAITVPSFFIINSTQCFADQGGAKVLIDDDFDRAESKPELEEVGNGWSTNSKSRAKGNKQVDLVDGAMHIVRHPVADHGVSVVHPAEFKDATISLRFKLGEKDDLGINIADPKEKSVHAGHLCVARIRTDRVEISDLKTGNMRLDIRTARKAKKDLTAEQKNAMKGKSKREKFDVSADKWHDLVVAIQGETMTVSIDGELVNKFSSPGIGHATKRLLRLAVNKSAWVDDVKVVAGDA